VIILKKWFHLRPFYEGDEIIIKPKIPEGIKGEDTTTPRISVAPSLRHCLAALTGIPHPFPALYQYIGKEKPISVYDKVPDAKWTHEHWLLKPSKFKFIANVVIHGNLGLRHANSWDELEQIVREVLNARQTKERDGNIHLWDESSWRIRPIILMTL